MPIKFKQGPKAPDATSPLQSVAPKPDAPPAPPKHKPRPLVIWSDGLPSKVLSALSPVLKNVPDLTVSVSNDFKTIPKNAVVLSLGAEGKEVFETLSLIPKGRTITSLRNRRVEAGDSTVLFSYSVGIKNVDYGKYVDLLCDLKVAARFAVTGSPNPTMGKYQWVTDFSQLIAEIEAQYAETGKPVPVCYDTETRGTDWLDIFARFVTLQFSAKAGTGYAVFIPSMDAMKLIKSGPIRDQVEWLLTTPKISLRAANGKFDFVWTWYHFGIECTNFKLDTTLGGNLLDENRSNSLDVHAKVYTTLGGYSDEFDATVDKSRMDLLPQSRSLLDYACGDTDAGLQVSEAVRADLIADNRLARFYGHILHPAARAFEVIERGGVFVDIDAYKELEVVLRKEMDELAKKAVSIMGGRIYAKHRDDTKPGGINLTKPTMLKDFMFSPMGLGLKPRMFTPSAEGTSYEGASTSYEHLMMFKDVPAAADFVKLIDEYSSASKTLSTYVIGFKKHLRSDGRFHPTYFLHRGNRDEDEGGTVTGRLSAKDPAFQTIPKHTKWGKLLRRIFKAPPGFVILERDYSQGELRVVACIANEKAMIQAYREGKDLHVLTGSFIVNMTYEAVMALAESDPDRYEAIRQPGKPANFGLLYGQSPEGFQHYAENNYGVKMSLKEAVHNSDRFFQLYAGLPVYHREYKAFAHKHGYVISPLQRIRHLPLINSPDRRVVSGEERKAINSPVQSTLSDMMIWALGEENAQGGFKVAPCFGVVHDAAYDYVPEDNVVSIVEKKRALMENLPFHKVGWNPQLKFIADCKVGPNMADLKKIKAAA